MAMDEAVKKPVGADGRPERRLTGLPRAKVSRVRLTTSESVSSCNTALRPGQAAHGQGPRDHLPDATRHRQQGLRLDA